MAEENRLEEIKRRLRELVKDENPNQIKDAKELVERQEAAQAYAGEDEAHFVSYIADCVKTSVTFMRKIRESQRECFAVYNEDEPPTYARKEKWQSKVVLPKPNSTVQFAMATIRKAFSVDFLSVQNPLDEQAAKFWEKIMKHHLGKDKANFALQFTDASGMGFAVGQSLEMIPVWRPGAGLRYINVEPWKIHRDPDAAPRDPQSGMYWIHQEWVDLHRLMEAERQGRYQNIKKVKDSTGDTSTTNPAVSRSEVEKRKEMIWSRSDYRKAILTSEFWGTILDKHGDLLLPDATYTAAGNSVIKLPRSSPYPTIRWPGVSFSPMPHFLRYDGRGLIHGVKTLWYFMCSLMCLHNDYLNWIVNPMRELMLTGLIDQDDLELFPGKLWLTRETVNGQAVVRNVDQKFQTNEVMAWLNFSDQYFQKGTMVTDAIQGLPGWRQEVTAREKAQDLDQAMGAFSLMGANIEDGAINAVRAGAETLEANIGVDDLAEIFGAEMAQSLVEPQSPTGVKLPKLTGSFHISGMSAVMKDFEVMKALRDMILPLAEPGSIFLPYLKPFAILKAIEKRANLEDEGILVTMPEATSIDQKQQQVQEETIGQEEALAVKEAEIKAQNMEAQNAALTAQAKNQEAQALVAGQGE